MRVVAPGRAWRDAGPSCCPMVGWKGWMSESTLAAQKVGRKKTRSSPCWRTPCVKWRRQMNEVTIHLYCRSADGKIEDAQHTFDLSDFGGFLPAVGDKSGSRRASIAGAPCPREPSPVARCGSGFSIHATPRISSLWSSKVAPFRTMRLSCFHQAKLSPPLGRIAPFCEAEDFAVLAERIEVETRARGSIRSTAGPVHLRPASKLFIIYPRPKLAGNDPR